MKISQNLSSITTSSIAIHHCNPLWLNVLLGVMEGSHGFEASKG